MYKGIGKTHEPVLGMGSNVLEREMQGNMGKKNMYQNHIRNKKKPADQMIKEETEETRETA